MHAQMIYQEMMKKTKKRKGETFLQGEPLMIHLVTLLIYSIDEEGIGIMRTSTN
jgi:hypothetical protein